MSTFMKKLLSISGDELSSNQSVKDCSVLFNSPIAAQLDELLREKNGFYGFESALHVFPYETTDKEIGLLDWNEKELWISAYEDMALDALYFAEDIFGGQFCLKDDGVYYFDPETANVAKLANTINEWSKLILSDYRVITGYPLAHSWQLINGPIPTGCRLVPKIPFIAGGLYELSNLYMCTSHESLKIRANIALQVRDIPDGSNIQIIISDE